jgi:hypothetical protein
MSKLVFFSKVPLSSCSGIFQSFFSNIMNKTFRSLRFLICLSACSLVLVGCSSPSDLNVLRDRSSDYKKAKVFPVLDVPKGIRAETFNDAYQIP